MAKVFTSQNQQQVAKCFMHDLLVAGGFAKNKRPTDPNLCAWMQYGYSSQITALCNELINRDFADIDSAITSLSTYHVCPNLDNSGKASKLNSGFIARSIVYMAELLNLYWDDTQRTNYEIDEFKKTLLGNAVYKYGRYITAIKDKSPKGTNRVSTPRVAGQQAKNDYYRSGSKLNDVRDLQLVSGAPSRVEADTNDIFYITGKSSKSKNPAIAHIKPLNKNKKYISGNTNKVCFEGGRGYGDCACFFDDPNDANVFLGKIINAGVVPKEITDLHVAKTRAEKIAVDDTGKQSGGYFLVGTEFGICAIKARAINESLELTNESAELDERTADWEKATEGYSQEELNELHKWMRRG